MLLPQLTKSLPADSTIEMVNVPVSGSVVDLLGSVAQLITSVHNLSFLAPSNRTPLTHNVYLDYLPNVHPCFLSLSFPLAFVTSPFFISFSREFTKSRTITLKGFSPW